MSLNKFGSQVNSAIKIKKCSVARMEETMRGFGMYSGGSQAHKHNEVGFAEVIDWYLYIIEPHDRGAPAHWLQENFRKLGEEIGFSNHLICGYTPTFSQEIIDLLRKSLYKEKWDQIETMFVDKIAVLACKTPISTDDEITILPVCGKNDSKDVVEHRMNEIVSCMRGNQAKTLFSQQGNVTIIPTDFNLLWTGLGAWWIRRLLRMIDIKIPLIVTTISLNPLILSLLHRYPR